jgi:ribonuclease P protein component
MATGSPNSLLRLRKHADYGRVYNASRKQFAKQITFFYSLRPADRRSETPGPRIGITVPKVLGKAHERNRIKRRLRECIRRHAGILTYPVDVILHPRRTTMDLEAGILDREVTQIFRTIQSALTKAAKPSTTAPAPPQ